MAGGGGSDDGGGGKGSTKKFTPPKIASNTIFRVASCLYILYDITYSIWLPKSTHNHSYVTFHFIAAFLTSD
jgi:hypothetical protein